MKPKPKYIPNTPKPILLNGTVTIDGSITMKSKDTEHFTTQLMLVPDASDPNLNSTNEALQEAVKAGITPIEFTTYKGGILALLKNIAVSASARLKYMDAVESDEEAAKGHKLVSEAILNWYEVRGCYITEAVSQEIAKAINVAPETFKDMDSVAISMFLGNPNVHAALQWYLTWFAYFISDIGPLNPTLRRIDLSMDTVNPVLTWITPNMIAYMSFIAGFDLSMAQLDLTLSELIAAVSVTRVPAIEQPLSKPKSTTTTTDQNKSMLNMRTETMQIPVCLMRLGGYTLSQRLLSSGGISKVSKEGSAADVFGNLAELFEDDNVLMALPLLLLSESTRQQCLRAIDTSFGMLNAFLQKSVHEKKPDWFVRMLPMQVVSQCMPIVMDVIIGSVLELEDIQEKARTLDEERYLEAKKEC